jgi:hypothetical protein
MTKRSTPKTFPFLLSREVANLLGCTPERLYVAIRTRRLEEPPRDSTGRFIWSPAHVELARTAILVDRRRREHRLRQAAEVTRHAR